MFFKNRSAAPSGARVFGTITHTEPGGYVLGVDLLRQSHLSSDTNAVLGPTCHQGTPDVLRATIVDIKRGERHELAPMRLPPALRAHKLTGTVKYDDGTPAAGATVMLLDPNRKWLDLAEPFETNASGAFSFVVHEGLSYTSAPTTALRTRAE